MDERGTGGRGLRQDRAVQRNECGEAARDDGRLRADDQLRYGEQQLADDCVQLHGSAEVRCERQRDHVHGEGDRGQVR